jgi:hypothetical protein
MRTEIRTHVYKTFSELTEANQLKLIDRNRDLEVCDNWWYEPVFDDAKHIGDAMGIDIEEIQFSGFCCQGDGARFCGHFRPKPEMESVSSMREEIRSRAPQDEELHEIADRLAAVQDAYGWIVKCDILFAHWVNDVHEYNTRFEFEPIGVDQNGDDELIKESDEREVIACLRRLMNWVYRRLETEYEYLTSDDYLRERLQDLGDEYEVEIEDGEETLV